MAVCPRGESEWLRYLGDARPRPAACAGCYCAESGILIDMAINALPADLRKGRMSGIQVVLPDEALPAKLTLNPELPMNDDAYYAFCMANPGVRFERTAQGEIIIMPPAGYESDYQILEVAA